MPRMRTHKTNFTAGEISPYLLGRGDLVAYTNGARTLRNTFIYPTGGLTRRAGLRYVDTARGAGRLVAFEFNTEQVYLLVFTDQHIDVYKDGANVADFAAPWTEAQIAQINWTQTADTLLVTHPDVPPKKITRTSHTAWTIDDWSYFEESGRIFQPHHKYAAADVTLTPSATTGTITLTASADVFVSDHVGVRMRIEGKEVEVTSYTSATSAQASVKETLGGTSATKDWEEQALSAAHGWPVSSCFHQDRLVIGGAREVPNRLWMSKSADLFNFDLGEGLDDEAIEFAILSDQVNAIRAVFSGRHLQVLTSGAEWMVSGAPLTPGNVQLHRQTRIGSPVDRTVPPRDVDGATLFVARTGSQLREFLFSDVEQAYQSADLAMLTAHVMDEPQDQDFDKRRRLFHVVMNNGTLGTVTMFRSEKVTAWTIQETGGSFRSIALVGEDAYALVERGSDTLIEVFDEDLYVDSGLTGTSGTPTATWSGLDHLEGETVKVLADGAVRADAVVDQGEVTLDEPASDVQIGLAFSHVVEPLPLSYSETQGAAHGGKVRLVSLSLRLHETKALYLDTGKGLTPVPFKRFGDDVLDAPPAAYSGDKLVRAYGWRDDGTEPLWRIEQDTPLPFTLLSVTTEFSANG